MSNLTNGHAVERAELVRKVATATDALIGWLGYDESFKEALANNLKETMRDSEILLHKEALDAYIRNEPKRFEQASEALVPALGFRLPCVPFGSLLPPARPVAGTGAGLGPVRAAPSEERTWYVSPW